MEVGWGDMKSRPPSKRSEVTRSQRFSEEKEEAPVDVHACARTRCCMLARDKMAMMVELDPRKNAT